MLGGGDEGRSEIINIEENPFTNEVTEEEGRNTSHNTSIKNQGGEASDCPVSSSSFCSSSENNHKRVSKESEIEAKSVFKEQNEVVQVDKSTEDVASDVVNEDKISGFHKMGMTSEAKENSVRAIIHGDYKNIGVSDQVKLRLLDDLTIKGVCIPKNTVVYSNVSLSANRVYLTTEAIMYQRHNYPFKAKVYDLDGDEGLNLSDKSGVFVSTTSALGKGESGDNKVTLPSGYRLIIKETSDN